MINLISDTLTKPTPPMLAAMMQAEVGDDVFQTDPTINALEAKAAKLFGMEAALFCPSGTMTNQLAIKTHTKPLDEVICDEKSHIHQSEGGSYAFHSGVTVNLLRGDYGLVNADMVERAIRPQFDWTARSTLVVLENTCNHGGGSFYTLKQVKPIAKVCKKRGLKLHLDGARLFNALVETGETPEQWGQTFDSISICLSKGLGAPVGSLLIGEKDFIRQARRFRKIFGGGMRQAGFLAAAGIYALDNNVERLKIDNDNAKKIGQILRGLPYVENLRPVMTNIVIFDVKAPLTGDLFLKKIGEYGIQAALFGPNTVRFVTHLHITDAMIDELIGVLKNLKID
jgi:threonine aldolase